MPKEIGWSTEAYLLEQIRKLIRKQGGGGGGGTVTSIATSGPLTGGPISITGTIGITQASSLTDGYLSSTDWSSFNSRVPSTRTINTSAPLQGGGALSSNRTLSMTQASAASNGWLSSTDYNKFNNKVDVIGLTANIIPSVDVSGTSLTNTILYNGGSTIGINQTSPGYTLDISGSLHTDYEVYLATISGNVQIGNLTPQGYKFYVDGDAVFNGPFTVFENTGTTPVATFYSSATNGIGVKIIGDFTTTDEVFTIFQNVYNTNIFQITAKGGVCTMGFIPVSGGGPYIGLADTAGQGIFSPLNGGHLTADSSTPTLGAGLKFINNNGEQIFLYVHQTTSANPAIRISGTGTTLKDDDTYDGYTLAQIVGALKSWGLLQ